MNATTDQPTVTTTTSEQDAQPAAEEDRTIMGDGRATSLDVRELLVNDRASGPAYRMAVPVEQVTAIHGLMIDLDCKILNPDVVGQASVDSADVLYEQHVRVWLDRDDVLGKAEVRNTGGGLHVLLWLDPPILCTGGEARQWDRIARGIRNALPGDPNVNGIIAMTRPVGALNTKYNPPRLVRVLREGQAISRDEILSLSRQMIEEPASTWMRLFFGDRRASPCPLCQKGESLGVAGKWNCKCYECGYVNGAALVYRFYASEFLTKLKEASHG